MNRKKRCAKVLKLTEAIVSTQINVRPQTGKEMYFIFDEAKVDSFLKQAAYIQSVNIANPPILALKQVTHSEIMVSVRFRAGCQWIYVCTFV